MVQVIGPVQTKTKRSYKTQTTRPVSTSLPLRRPNLLASPPAEDRRRKLRPPPPPAKMKGRKRKRGRKPDDSAEKVAGLKLTRARSTPSSLDGASPASADGVDLAVAMDDPPRWESVVKVVPSMDAVVKVFCVHTEPNFSLPWQRKRQYSSSSSGFIVGGRRVLTNAHSVEHHTQVKLKKRGSDTKYLATVLAIGTECDIGMRF